MSVRARRILLAGVLLTLPLVAGAAENDGWFEIDYSELVDRRALTHSGEPVGVVLQRLGGRELPAAGSGGGVRLAHGLLDPLLEPYAFVVLDALEAGEGLSDPPPVEIGRLWQAGERQPAWAELLRARRYLVAGDGGGRMRVVLPWNGDPATASGAAAREAYARAWPLLRLIFDAERRRHEQPTALEVEVRAYRHLPERSRFVVGQAAYRVRVEQTRSDGNRPPLDFEALQAFLDSGLQLEGARLTGDGDLRLFGSRTPGQPPRLLGRSLTPADFAVAYRAVFHGGLAEPYMSLDRGASPQQSVVNYGGRLRDTPLGLVSLLCDIRFKTFSLGLDIAAGRDVRQDVRRRIPGFLTHLERLAADTRSLEVSGQQTRLWFYPDRVDMTVSAQGDLLGMRRVRMSAASERVEQVEQVKQVKQGDAPPQQREDPPWTLATVAAIDRDYDELAGFFPELADLDQVVRLLSLFTWLKQAQLDGLLVPELDELLALPLPELYTPRTYPQQLAFNALPEQPGGGEVLVFDRVDAAQGLENLNAGGPEPLSPRRRFERAMRALDPQDPAAAALLEQLRGADPARLGVAELDLLAHRAERLRMHNTVLATQGTGQQRALAARESSGERLRVFSVAIGGLDLDMGQALKRARGRSLDLLGAGAGAGMATDPALVAAAPTGERRVRVELPREEWQRELQSPSILALPAYGRGQGSPGRDPNWARAGGDDQTKRRWQQTVYGMDGPEVSARRVVFEGPRNLSIERLHEGRWLRYRFEGGSPLRAVVETGAVAAAVEPTASDLPAGLARMRLLGAPQDPDLDSPSLTLQLEGEGRRLAADFPRAALQRLVAGRAADLTPGQRLPGISPLPPNLGRVEALMVMQEPAAVRPPWDGPTPALPGEEDAAKLARALNAWWRTEEPPTAAAALVGTDLTTSANRWQRAPRAGASATLWLPRDAFRDGAGELRARLAQRWTAGPVVDDPAGIPEVGLIVLVSDEAPALLAQRLRGAALDPAFAGRLLAVWPLAGPVRADLPAALLASSALAGLGLGQTGVLAVRGPERELQALSGVLVERGATTRVEQLPGDFVWYF